MHTEHILPEDSYLSETIPQLDALFVKVLLPLLFTGCTQTSRWSSQGGSLHPPTDTSGTDTAQLTHSHDDTSSTSPQDAAYCWCGGGEVG